VTFTEVVEPVVHDVAGSSGLQLHVLKYDFSTGAGAALRECR